MKLSERMRKRGYRALDCEEANQLEAENEALHAFANAITMDVTSKIIELQEKLDDALKETNND